MLYPCSFQIGVILHNSDQGLLEKKKLRREIISGPNFCVAYQHSIYFDDQTQHKADRRRLPKGVMNIKFVKTLVSQVPRGVSKAKKCGRENEAKGTFMDSIATDENE